jgi:hypothetical protein
MRTCCFIPCGKPAEFQITGTIYETETDACGDHVFALATEDSCHVSVIKQPVTRPAISREMFLRNMHLAQ